MRSSLWRGCALPALALALAAGCSKTKTDTHSAKTDQPKAVEHAEPGQPVTTAAAANPPVPAASAKVPYYHAPVARESLVAPPLTAPAEAAAGPGGVRVQTLRAGNGEKPGPTDTLIVDYSMWTGDGKLAMSSYLEERSVPFSVDTLPPPLRSLLTELQAGAKARYWVPRAALEGWRPPEWPDSDLVIELVLIDVNHVTFRDLSGNVIDSAAFPAPDAAGPPPTARTTRNGLKYTILGRGGGTRPPNIGERVALTLDAYAIDGLLAQPIARGQRTATTLERAPGGLGDVLTQLRSGDTVRVWFPRKFGAEVIPQAGDRELVLDVRVTFAE